MEYFIVAVTQVVV